MTHEHTKSKEPIRVRSVEPLIEELTGPLTLLGFGYLLRRLPDYILPALGSTNRLGTIALLIAVAGIVALIVKHVRASSAKRSKGGLFGHGTSIGGLVERIGLSRTTNVTASGKGPTAGDG